MRITAWYYRDVSDVVVKTVKISKSLASALKRAAKARGCSESDLIREGIEHVTGEGEGIDMAAALGRGIGIGKGGPPDLSSNREHMRGFGRSRDG